MTVFTLPDLGEGLQEAEIVTWHVSAGDHVVADQPLVSVETQKAVVEIPSPHAGYVAKLHGEPGDIINVGGPLVEFKDAAPTDAGAVVGTIAEAAPETSARGAPAPVTSPAPQQTRMKVAPAVRALAKELGVDFAMVMATGKNGQVTKADVEGAAGGSAAVPALEPMRGVRRAMAKNMARAHAEVVPTTVIDEADVDHWPSDTDVTLRLIHAVAAGCAAEPALNAWFDAKREGRRLHRTIDIGIAMDTADGLFVPVLRGVGDRDSSDLRRGLDAMRADVEARTVPPSELRGQTMTLSNFGMMGGRFAALVVVPPQVAILGAGRIIQRVVAVDGEPAVHRTLPLSLTFDHRAATGGEAARFLAAVIADLEGGAEP